MKKKNNYLIEEICEAYDINGFVGINRLKEEKNYLDFELEFIDAIVNYIGKRNISKPNLRFIAPDVNKIEDFLK